MAYCDGYSLVGTSGVNGDAFFLSPDRTTFLLADGASGAGREGKVIMSQHCVETVKAHPFSRSGLSAKGYLDAMIWEINNGLISLSQEKRRLLFGTVLLCVVQDSVATIGAVGDSPAYLIRKAAISQVAKPPKTYQNLIDTGWYSQEQLEEAVRGLPEPMWSMFDRFLPMVVPAYTVEEIPMEPGDILVMCSDGVSDYLDPSSIKDAIRAAPLSQSIREIIHMARDRAVQERNCLRYDDLTMVVYCH